MCFNSSGDDIALNIFGGVATAIIIELFRWVRHAYKYRKISILSGLYKSTSKEKEELQFWIRIDASDTILDLTGGRNFEDLGDITIEGQISVRSSRAVTATGYYIDHFDNAQTSYIGNGKLYIKIINKDRIDVTSDYLTNQTHEGITTTVMVKQTATWTRWK